MNEQDNISNSFPEELNYSEENWQMALEKIEAHDAAVRRKKLGIFALCFSLAVVFFSTYAYYTYSDTSQKNNQITEINDLLKSNQNTEKQLDSKNIIEEETKTNEVVSKDLAKEESSKNMASQKPMDAFTTASQTSDSKAKQDKINKESNDRYVEVQDQSTKDSLLENAHEAKSKNDNLDKGLNDLGLDEYPIKDGKTEMESSIDRPNDSSNLPDDLFIKEEGILYQKEDKLTLDMPSSDQYLRMSNVQSKWVYRVNPYQDYSGLKSLSVDLYEIDRRQPNNFVIPDQAISLKVGLNPWMDYGNDQNWSKLNWVYGIEYEKNYTHKHSLTGGLEFFSISDLPLELHSSSVTYGYGFEEVRTSLKTTQLNFVSLPVQYSYRLKDRIQVSAGMGASFLLSSKNDISKSRFSNSGEEQLSSESASNYLQGFNRTTFYSSVGAKYWVTNKLCLQTTYQFGLSDFTVNEEFESNELHRNSRLEFSVKRIIK